MPRRDRLQELLDRLAEVRDDPTSPEHSQFLRTSLAHKSGLVVRVAARIVSECELHDLGELLSPAFAEMMIDPVKRDPQCRAKVALVEAMHKLGNDDLDVYWQGLSHVQEEPVWTRKVEDTAAELRARCAIALMDAQVASAWVPVTLLLLDKFPTARAGAAAAIGRSGQADIGVPVLRLKLAVGERDTEVLAAALRALLALQGQDALPVVTGYFKRPPAEREAAILALGESRLECALDPLCDLCERAVADTRRIAMLAIAMLRTERAWSYLLGVIEDKDKPKPMATDAVRALAIYRYDQRVRTRVERAIASRSGRALVAAFAEHFGGGA